MFARQVVFDATPTHERDGPDRFLTDFAPSLRVSRVRRAVCEWTNPRNRVLGHARRRFVEAFMTDTTPARLIAFMQQLYDVERAAAELTPEARRALRQEHSAPLLTQIDAERARLTAIVLPKWVTGCGISRINGPPCSDLSRTAASPSTTTVPRTSCASSPWAGRTGCLQAASKPPPCRVAVFARPKLQAA